MKLFDRNQTLLFIAGLTGLAAWSWFRFYTGITLEDALITFRYAQNLAEGNGFVYNLGERVLGTTTPFLTLILGFLGWIFGASAIPLIANIFLFACSVGAGLFTFWALRACSFSRGFAGLVLIGFYLHPLTLWTTAGGMETPLVVCLMALSFWGVGTRRFSLAGYASGLLVLTRIDGIFWAGGIFLIILLEDRKAFVRSAALALIAVVPWLLFAQWYFGSFIPHTVIAKQSIGNEVAFGVSGLLSEARWFANRFGAAAPFATIIGIALFLQGLFVLFWRSNSRVLRWLAVYPFVFALAFYFGRAPRFPWYFVPVAWSALIVGLIGLHYLWASWSEYLRLNSTAVAAILGMLWIGAFIWQDYNTADFHRAYQINEDGTRRELGLWLKENTPTDAVVAMEAIGYQGYYSERRVIDLAGLVSPQVVQIRKANSSNADTFEDIWFVLKPDYIILRSYEYEENEHFHGGKLFNTDLQKVRFDAAYQPVKKFIAPLPEFWGKLSRLTIFQRID